MLKMMNAVKNGMERFASVLKIMVFIIAIGALSVACDTKPKTGGGSSSGGNISGGGDNGTNDNGTVDNGTGGGGAIVIPTIPKKEFLEAVKELEIKGVVPVLDRSDSIMGEDRNNDGVRDDIENYIMSLPDTPAQKAALRQHAKTYTARFLAAQSGNESELENASYLSERSMACTFNRYGWEGSSKRIRELQKYTVNTIERARVYSKYNSLRSGSTSTSLNGDTCDE